MPEPSVFPDDPWAGLRAYTAARIALGRTGSSVPLREALAFRLAHAHARDAVYSILDLPRLTAGLTALALPAQSVRSRAATREQYLQRPDYGRQLTQESRQLLQDASAPEAADVALILADGLSATAVNEHALPLLRELLPKLQQAGFRLAPVVLAEQARVALSDEIGELLGARLALMLIGERPGLSAPHSLGAYLTYAPRPGRTDEARNCVSNIRPEGLPYAAAADKLFYLIHESLRRQLSGVALKDETGLLGE
ncbi:ethanolamine ammonia-lyase subunit EutC [Hymenobacter perfusus]|uniref:Ethanolamine ammonia-lyase small subunit n=1 Tax=Hymenobacter perfusus TaxID=1236770 RepID=A0A3R9NW45_9BACT|nr:ethanolamine ammonia-lyase subunit EutC [Hymenobacter perfusus]RSK44754.1 ethanolamine ammonia-lyase subunit EutC [Hymenobacter perfusus]